jgi:asparaginyl-tRNA synthetase
MIYVNELQKHIDTEVNLHGWVYNYRSSKQLYFLEFRDGTGICQCIISKEDVSEDIWEKANSLTQESSIQITGKVVADERSMGGVELHLTDLSIYQIAKDYPITPKEHGVEFLMDRRHLWLRSKRQWAIMRIRNEVIFAIHSFFQDRGFVQMDSPIFTANEAEGSSTLFETEFFDQKAYLAQTGQLYGEALAMALNKIYTFGPTFRAEKSKTRRHLSEFWMIEPEMAFYDLPMNMDLAEAMLKHIITTVLARRADELSILERDTQILQKIANNPFTRITYTDAANLLASDKTRELMDGMTTDRLKEKEELETELTALKTEYGQAKKYRKTQIDRRNQQINARITDVEEDLRNYPQWKEAALNTKWGDDFGGSDETILTLHYDSPIIVTHYPTEIKAFYMKRDPQNPKVVLAMDVLAPEGYGEIIGGSQREDDMDLLMEMVNKHQLNTTTFEWYLDLRRYGSVPHAGFGLGLERTVAWMCGIKHVRETIPFPRMMGRLTP